MTEIGGVCLFLAFFKRLPANYFVNFSQLNTFAAIACRGRRRVNKPLERILLYWFLPVIFH